MVSNEHAHYVNRQVKQNGSMKQNVFTIFETE